MKKSIAAILALVLMMTVVFFGCGKKEDDEAVNNDNTTQQVTGESSTQSNAPGDNQAGSTDNTNTSDTTDVSDITNVTGVTNAIDSVGSSDSTDVTGATVPSKPDFSTSQPNNSQQGTTPSQPASKVDKYKAIFSTGAYRMTVITETDGVEDLPIDFACKNGNVYMSMSMDGIPATMIYIAENDTAYMLFEMLGKFYTELTEELLGEEIDFTEATKGFDVSGDGVVVTGKGQFDGKTVDTETVTSDDKVTVFYFDANGTLLGTETTEADGTVSVTKISNLTTSVDDSLFEIPKDYKYMDISWLMNMA